MNVMIGAARLEFFFLLDDRRRRRDHDLLDFVNAAAFFAALHFENEAVLLAQSSSRRRARPSGSRFAKMLKSSISSLMSWKFFRPSCAARSLTMIGGLM